VIRREVLLWVRAAGEDFVDAEDALKRGRWFRTAFFAQQAVGKAFKALFFIVRREEPPRVHTVTELYVMLKESGFALPRSWSSSCTYSTSTTPSPGTPTQLTAYLANPLIGLKLRGPTT